MPKRPDVGAVAEQVRGRLKQIEDQVTQNQRIADELGRLHDAVKDLERALQSPFSDEPVPAADPAARQRTAKRSPAAKRSRAAARPGAAKRPESPPGSRQRVFISYASVDRREARRVAELYRRRGLDVWIDEGGLSAGEHLKGRLAEILDDVDLFVLLVSEASVRSKWVNHELEHAVARNTRIIPIRLDDSPLPEALLDRTWGNGRSDDDLARTVSSSLRQVGFEVPMSTATIQRRIDSRAPIEVGIRLVPSNQLRADGNVGAPERDYVFFGDYHEQYGRSLHQVLGNLGFGDRFDPVAESNLEWTAIIFEIGEVNARKLDVFPGTWKSVFRILADPKRLGILVPDAKEIEEMGARPRDYHDGDQGWWYLRLTSGERRTAGIGPGKELPDKVIPRRFGVDLCFTGTGTSYSRVDRITSRIYLMRNAPLVALNARLLDLGDVDDGRVVC